jgi:hypothetical protein
VLSCCVIGPFTYHVLYGSVNIILACTALSDASRKMKLEEDMVDVQAELESFVEDALIEELKEVDVSTLGLGLGLGLRLGLGLGFWLGLG